MGRNSRKYSLLKVNKYLLICIDTLNVYNLLDKTVPLILKESDSQTANELLDFIQGMDWEKDEALLATELKDHLSTWKSAYETLIENTNATAGIIPNPLPDPMPDPAPEPLPDPVPHPAPEPLPQPVPESTLESVKSPSYGIATAALRLMQNGQILPKAHFETLISLQVLLNEISHYQNAFEEPVRCQVPLVDGIVNFISELYHTGMFGSAEVIHNYLHLGHLLAKQAEKNKMDVNMLSQIIGPPLLDALELDGRLVSIQEGQFSSATNVIKKEYLLFSEITRLLLLREVPFWQPFDVAFYYNHLHRQKKEDRARENNRLCGLLWSQIKTPNQADLLESLTLKTEELSIVSNADTKHPGKNPKFKPDKKKKKNKSGSFHNPFHPLKRVQSIIHYPSEFSPNAQEGSPIDTLPLTFTPALDIKKNTEKTTLSNRVPLNKLHRSKKGTPPTSPNQDDNTILISNPKKKIN